jgi:DNA-binding transcriptional LysR family regulator
MDLNLYPVFIEIMRHGSVSRAAEALGLTQPATSNALSRLRHQMDDPLFVRTRGGMLPTHYAREVLPSIERAVDALRALQDEPPGELPPLAGLTRHFRFIMSDLEETLFLPELIEDIETTAPGVSLEVRQFRGDRLQADLESGRADFVLAHLREPFKNVVSRQLANQEFICLSRRGNPALADGLSLKQYTSLGHVLVAPDRGGTRGVVDTRLHAMGKSRRVVCTVPHFLSGCVLVTRTDHLLTVPRLLGEKMVGLLALDLHELPFAMPGFSIGLHWHWTRESDPEHETFRTHLLGLLGDPQEPGRRASS